MIPLRRIAQERGVLRQAGQCRVDLLVRLCFLDVEVLRPWRPGQRLRLVPVVVGSMDDQPRRLAGHVYQAGARVAGQRQPLDQVRVGHERMRLVVEEAHDVYAGADDDGVETRTPFNAASKRSRMVGEVFRVEFDRVVCLQCRSFDYSIICPMPKETVLTGVTTTGTPHLGNYVGAIRPGHRGEPAGRYAETFWFLADYHALVKSQSPDSVHRSSLEVAATWLALGLDTDRAYFYRQTDIPEIPELTWILNAVTAKGLMNRAHAYKAAVAGERGRRPEGSGQGHHDGAVLLPGA